MPIVPAGRVVGLDVARYLALVGMIATHALVSTTPDGGATLVQQVAGGRASALFAVLAGVSTALMSGGRTPLRGRARTAAAAGLAVRAVIVFAIGLFLGSLDTTIAVILSYYGVLFLLGTLFLGLRARELALLALAWAVVSPLVSHAVRPELPPRTYDSPMLSGLIDHPGGLLAELLFTGYYPAVTWLTYLLAGMAIGRCDLRRLGTATRLVAIGAVAALGTRLLSAWLVDDPGVLRGLRRTLDEVPHQPGGLRDTLEHGLYGSTPTGSGWWLVTSAPHSATPFDLVHTAGSAMVVIGLCLLVTRIGTRAWAVVCGAGAMTLTLYTLHVVLRTPTFWPEDTVDTFWLHVAAVTAIGALFRLAGRSGPVEKATAVVAGRVRQSVASK